MCTGAAEGHGMSREAIAYDIVFPSPKEYAQIHSRFPYESARRFFDVFEKDNMRYGIGVVFSAEGQEQLSRETRFHSCILHLRHRVQHVHQAWTMLTFYLERGIPDEPWQERGRYFPRFESQHWFNQKQFNFYADVFYHKIFAASETLHKSLRLILPKNKSPLKELRELLSEEIYTQAKRLRDDITHNAPPNSIGFSEFEIFRDKKGEHAGSALAGPVFVTSGRLMQNMDGMLALFWQALDLCTAHAEAINANMRFSH